MAKPPQDPHATARHLDRRQLRCIKFLETHFEQGGVDRIGFEMLHTMVEMIAAIGWEVHLIWQSKIAGASSLAKMEWYIDCMLQGCSVFHTNMRAASTKAKEPSHTLPTVDANGRAFQAELSQWQEKLKTLHDPTGNDARLFQLLLEHFDRHAYLRLHRLMTRKPAYGLDQVMCRANELYEAFHGLCQIALEADRRVIALEEMIRKADQFAAARAAREPSPASPEMLGPTVYMAPLSKVQSQPPITNFSMSFSIVEEDMSLRRHARAATVPEADHNVFANVGNVGELGHRGALIGTRRKVPHIPRVFTGSFSQLESEIRKMKLDKIQTPELAEGSNNEQVKIRDFGATPLISPCVSPTTSATTSLCRREAMVSRETMLQDRVINGELITSRRPSTKERAQTIDNSFDLEAWLKQDSKMQSPGKKRLDVRRGDQRHREKTL